MTLDFYFGLAVGAIHIIVDYFTSRLNKKLWVEKKVHWFFVSLGFDQFIHCATLIYLKGIF